MRVVIPTAIPIQSEIKLSIGFSTPIQLMIAEPSDVANPMVGLFDSVSIIIS